MSPQKTFEIKDMAKAFAVITGSALLSAALVIGLYRTGEKLTKGRFDPPGLLRTNDLPIANMEE